MGRVLYLDCFSGISGDMVIGAFLDAGLPFDDLERALGSLAVSGYHVTAERVLRAGVSATKFSVVERGRDSGHVHESGATHTSELTHLSTKAPQHQSSHAPKHLHDHDHPHDHDHAHAHAHHHPHRSLPEIFALIDQSALSTRGRDRAKALFQRLAEAEAAIHQMPVERVHLHEVGALDSIIDIVGAVFAMEWAGVDQVVCSPLNVGGGMVHSAHGHFPVPAPATVRLLGDAPVYGGAIAHEMVTPTGALLATGYATSFGPVPAMRVSKVGYGAGTRDHAGTPNVLRILIGAAAEHGTGDRVTLLECEIDDMNPQLFGSTMERLYENGAIEVFYTPVQMKKNRPGTLLTVLCRPEDRQAITEVIFAETTTLGLRHSEVAREVLDREVVSVDTPYGAVRVKLSRRHGRIMNAVPEFDDCAALARTHNVPVKDVQAAAVQASGVHGRAEAR